MKVDWSKAGKQACSWLEDAGREIVEGRLPDDDAFDQYDQEKADLYFSLYVVPVLEGAGLANVAEREHGILWGRTQLCLGMHLRYADALLDGDATGVATLAAFERSRLYLFYAQEHLKQLGRTWDSEHETLYCQFLEYEREIREGMMPHFSLQWRRVSPLGVVPQLYLSDRIYSTFLKRYRHYLSWSLVAADCSDVLRDLSNGVQTPLVYLAKEYAGPASTPNADDVFLALQSARVFLKSEIPQTEENTPLWNCVIEQLAASFGRSLEENKSKRSG